MKYQNGVEKALLRDACKDLLPEELLHRKKSPYPKTYHPGYEKLLIAEMQHILDQPDAPVKTFIDTKKLETFLEAPTEYGKPWFGQLMAGAAAARLLHPDQLLDAEIPPESVISGWVEAQPRLSGLAVCRVISFMYAWKGSGAQNETCSNCLFINISFLTALIVYIHSAMDSPHNMSVS